VTGQKTVRETVWPWDQPVLTVDQRSGLRRKALIQALVMVSVAGLILLLSSHRIAPAVLCCLAVLNLVLGLAAPLAFGVIDRGMQRFGLRLAQGATWLLLTPFFFLVFVPARLALAARGRDPMKRRFPDTLPSYWTSRRPVDKLDDYRKQF
jgi:hypothetical protein